jgi:hypothetical protein
LETQNKLPPFTQADLAFNTLPIKDYKLEKETLPVMFLKMLMVLFLYSAQYINKILTNK